MPWEIKIERISNAYVLNWKDDSSDNDALTVKEAYQDTEESWSGQKEALIKALYGVIEYFGQGFNKHYAPNDKFIKVKLVSGDDYDDEAEEYKFVYPVLTAEEVKTQYKRTEGEETCT